MVDTHIRRAHVKRIYQQDPNTGQLNPFVYIDVLRIDQVFFNFSGMPSGAGGAGVVVTLKWNDDPNNANSDIGEGDQQQENANRNRRTFKLKIINPDSEAQSIDLWIVQGFKVLNQGGLQPGDSSGTTGQSVKWTFNNTLRDSGGDFFANATPVKRGYTSVKMVNNDLGGPPSSNGDGFGGGLDMTQGPVDWETYKQALINGTIDDSQSLKVEITNQFRISLSADMSSGTTQTITYGLANKPLEELFQDYVIDKHLIDE